MGFSRGAGGGNRPVTKVHVIVLSLLLVGIFGNGVYSLWFKGWLAQRRALVDVSSSPRLARAEAALRDLDACSIEYDRNGIYSGKGARFQDVFIVAPCGAAGKKRYRVPESWKVTGYKLIPFELKRDSRGEAWRVHALAKPDELAKALEEASPALHRPMPPPSWH